MFKYQNWKIWLKCPFCSLLFLLSPLAYPKLTAMIQIFCTLCKSIFLQPIVLYCGAIQRKQQTSFNVRDSPVCGFDGLSPKRLSFKTPLSANGSVISQNGSLEGKAEKESF